MPTSWTTYGKEDKFLETYNLPKLNQDKSGQFIKPEWSYYN